MVAASKAGRFAETGAHCESPVVETSASVQVRRKGSVALCNWQFPSRGMIHAEQGARSGANVPAASGSSVTTMIGS